MEKYDVAIIGGGVVGVSILYELTLRGYKCVLLEKHNDLVSSASSGNSGIIHSGFDAEPGTLEFDLILKSNDRLRSFLRRHKIPVRTMGAIMIAHNREELKKIEALHKMVSDHSVTESRLLSRAEVRRLEPHLAGTVIGGLLIPQEAVTDSCLYAVTMAHQSVKHGAKVLTDHEVVSLHQPDPDTWQLTTKHTPVHCKLLINAAGLYGDCINHMGLGFSSFRIAPRQGDFLVLEKEASNLVKHIILPIPTKKTKGVLIYPSVYGNLVIGPTAEDIESRENPVTKTTTETVLKAYGDSIVPGLARYQMYQTYAGIRPATEYKDYQIQSHKNRRWVTVGGIRSTGLTASVGIACYVAELVGRDFPSVQPASPAREETDTSEWSADSQHYKLDNKLYTITHKLMKIGLQLHKHAKL